MRLSTCTVCSYLDIKPIAILFRQATKVCALLLLAGSALAAPTENQITISERIQTRFENSLYTLPPEIQAHWALRLYRSSGDERYRYPILAHAILLERNLSRDLDGWGDADYMRERVARHLESFSGKSRKSRARRAMFEKNEEELILLRSLSSLYRLNQLGFHGADMERARALIAGQELAHFLLEEDVVDIYAAQAVNYVYYLHQLGLADVRKEFREVFQRCFPDSRDEELSKLRFKDKIYGLTHFILADSGYFESYVDYKEHVWILEYFEANLERILHETKADIIAEVGLCFLLAERDDSPVVHRTREAVAGQFDAKGNMIPSVSGDWDLLKGEHRNVLAYLLLSEFGELHPGPDLMNWDESRRRLAP